MKDQNCSLIYGVNTLINTPLWGLIEEKLNTTNFQWENVRFDDGQRDEKFRKGEIAWIGDDYLRKQLFYSVDFYNKQNWRYDINDTEHVQYGIYSHGGHYDWHYDESIIPPSDQSFMRKLSVTIWLNFPDEYEGGEFDIQHTIGVDEAQNGVSMGYETFKLSKGSIIIFPSFIWHRVRPVTSGVRKSLVVWFIGPPFR